MLKFLTRRNRSKKIVLILVIAAVAIGIAVAVLPSSVSNVFGGKTSANADSTVARVGKYRVTVKELRDSLNAFGQQMSRGQGSTRTDDIATLYGMYGQNILDNLIRQKLIQYVAEDLNLVGTDDEVRQKLREMFNPWPGSEQYRSRLRNANFTVEQFEENLRASISEEKVKSLITAAAQVSDAEVEADYLRNKTNYNVQWVEVQPDKFREKVQFQESDLRAYFDQHKDEFKINSEQRRARYIVVDQTKAGETINPTDDELKKDFNPERGVQEVRVSQIVLNIPKAASDAGKNAGTDKNASTPAKTTPPDTEAEIRKKAEDIISRARGEGKPAEDFAKLARELSQDAKTRAAGGDIGWVKKKSKPETDDPLNRAFEMSNGEVSTPIKKGDKFYILKVTDRKVPTFEQAREQLVKEARVSRGYTRALEISDEAATAFKESKDAQAVVNQINARYKIDVAAAKESPFFAATESPKELSVEFVSAVFELKDTGEIGERQSVANGFAVPQYIDKRDPHDAPFEEVKDRVEESYRANKAKDLALEQARELAKSASPDALKAAAERVGLKIDGRTSATGSDALGPLTSEFDRKAVYKLKSGEVGKDPIKVSGSDSFVVAALVSRKDPDMGEEFKKDAKAIRERLLGDEKEMLFSTYLATAQKQLKDQGKIKVYRDVIDLAIGEPQPQSQSPMRPGAPLSPGRRRGPNPIPPPQ